MADAQKILFQAQLGNVDAQVAAPGAGVTWTISKLHICNTGAAATFRLHDASGGASNVANALYYDTPIGANSVLVDSPYVMANGRAFRGLGSVANQITLTAYGIETT